MELANRLLEQDEPFAQIVKRLSRDQPVAKGKRLSAEQLAVGTLMCSAVSEFSENKYAAGWLSNIEHLLWDEVVLRKEDAYERACARLRKLAGSSGWRRPRKRSLFTEGLKLLSERYGVWFFYDDEKGERPISIEEWLPKHQARMARELKERMSYQKVWELANWNLLQDKPRKIPPMPRIKLPPINA